MILDFSLTSFRSVGKKQKLPFRASRIGEYYKNLIEPEVLDYSYLKVLSIYGANSSGKSNLIRGMGMMKSILFNNFNQKSTEKLPFDPFLLSEKIKPTEFEITFLTSKKNIYRYGFEFNAEGFIKEWLFQGLKKEFPLFIRIDDGIEVFETFPEGKDLEEKTRQNALFLSVVNQFNGVISEEIIKWFHNFNVIDGVGHSDYRSITFGMLDNEESRSRLINFYKKLDLGFHDVIIDKSPFSIEKIPFEVPEDIKKQMVADMEGKMMASLNSVHYIINKSGKELDEKKFHVRTQESAGTNKIIDLSGPIFDTIDSGGILVIDELDAKLHPHLTLSILKLFQLEETNPNNAQLIFTTHNTNILSLGNLRRDQIIFTEKDKKDQTELYRLVDYQLTENKKVRNDMSFEKDYLKGRYGAVPAISDISTFN